MEKSRGISKYKTVVIDYEGMQACLDQHSEQGWMLHTVSPDSWRKVAGLERETHAGDEGGPNRDEEEYVASYYLLVFVREDDPQFDMGLAAATQELPETGYPLRGF